MLSHNMANTHTRAHTYIHSFCTPARQHILLCMADWLSWRRGMALTERAASVINARKVSEKLRSILIYLLAYLNSFNLALNLFLTFNCTKL